MPEEVLRLERVCKSYDKGKPTENEVLHSIDLVLRRGEFAALIGPSGSGKSTLLNVVGLLDRPDSGKLYVQGEDTSALDERSITKLRGHTIGFVFQYHYLLSAFTAMENVMMPLRIGGMEEAAAKRRAMGLLDRVGLSGRMSHRPSALSGGEQQRTAVARALAADPAVLLADEPSGNLDHMNSERLHDLFAELARELEIAMVVVTHNRSLASRADRILQLEDAKLTQIGLPEVVA